MIPDKVQDVILFCSKEEVEKCKQKDLLEQMLKEMTGEFPALSQVFVQERDMFLANSLRLAAQPILHPDSPTGELPPVQWLCIMLTLPNGKKLYFYSLYSFHIKGKYKCVHVKAEFLNAYHYTLNGKMIGLIAVKKVKGKIPYSTCTNGDSFMNYSQLKMR